MDIVFIEHLVITATIGVHPWEKQHPQKLVFDIEMGWDNQPAAISDNISDCLNYADVTKTIVSIIDNKHFSLIERVAEETAKNLMNRFQLPWIRVKVRKPSAIVQANSAGVIIERRDQSKEINCKETDTLC